jgi:hypothetical protein
LIQRALAQTSWREYFSGGKKYFHNVRVQYPLPHASRSPVSPGRDKGVKMGDARRTFVVVGGSRERGFRCRDSVRLPLKHCPCSSILCSVVCSQATWPATGHRRGLRCSRSASKRSSSNKRFTIHADGINPYSSKRSRVTTDLFPPSQT